MQHVGFPYRDIDDAIIADAMKNGETGQHLFALCDGIGTRFAGTEGDRRAADLIRGTFNRYGLDRVQLEEFPFTAWRRGGGAQLRMLEPRACALPCYAMPYGAATRSDGIAATWVDIGSGSASEIEKNAAAIRGAFAITDGSSGPRKAIQRLCATAGSVGVLHGHKSDGALFKTGSVDDGKESPIPAVSITAETLAMLRRVDRPGRLHLAVDCFCEASTTYNVVGALCGTAKPDELVIMGGHYDSHDISPGAYDNATGVTLVMEVARLLAPFRQHLKRTLRFVAFGAEEMGLLGSHHHARTHAAALRKARLMLNCDTPCLGHPHGLGFHKCAEAEPLVQKLSAEMGEEILFGNRHHNSSDHYPFLRQGVITAGVGGKPGKSRGAAYYHTAADTLDKLEIDALSGTASFLARVLLRVCNDDRWPQLRHDAAG
ncbi:MAG: M28 family peptidase [Kiritimatiellia bacterium]